MAIFGDEKFSDYGKIVRYPYSHNRTSLDVAMNYAYGITLLAMGIVGIFLNSLVLYEKLSNRQSRRKLTSVLFQLLAAANIFLLLLRTIWPSYFLLMPTQLPLQEIPATLWSRVYNVVQSVFSGASMTLVLLICIVRYFKIRDPSQGTNSHRCMVAGCVGALLVYIVFAIVVPAIFSCSIAEYYAWDYTFFSIHIYKDYEIKYFETMTITIAGMFFSGLASLLFSSLTICSLRSSAGQSLSDAKRKRTYTILCLNIPDIVCPVIALCAFLVLYNTDFWPLEGEYTLTYLIFFVYVMLQPITATYYAAIICARSSTIKKLLAGWWRTLRVRGRGYQPI